MRKEKCFIILTFMLRTAVVSSIATSCVTLDHKKGVCIQIDYCPHFKTLLQNHRDNKDTLKYILQAFCGFSGKTPKVCCPPKNSQTNNSSRDYAVLSSQFPNQQSCGRSHRISINMRIIGGKQSTLGAWPWIAALGYQYNSCRKKCTTMWNCGGTLISKTHVLTAAHCVGNDKYTTLKIVRLGEFNLNDFVNDGATPLDVPVRRIIAHQNYDETKMINDIALIKLNESVTYDDFIQPICLPTPQTMTKPIIMNDMLVVIGWGKTSSKKVFEDEEETTLMEVKVPLTLCKKIKGLDSIIDDRVLCAGMADADSCQGDSGGPLMLSQADHHILLGVVSYGHMICGTSKYPGVYTNVSSFMDWIVKNVYEN